VFADAFAAAISGRPALVLAGSSDPRLDQPTLPRMSPAVAAGAMPTERLDGRPIDRTDALISTALAKAQRLIEGRRMTEALQSLEATLATLPAMLQADARSCADAWRIETVLAALYDTTGKQERARRMALVAYRHALQSGCPLAEGRASELVDRLVTRGRRVARGSTGSQR
jgi:hypothetical protein